MPQSVFQVVELDGASQGQGGGFEISSVDQHCTAMDRRQPGVRIEFGGQRELAVGVLRFLLAAAERWSDEAGTRFGGSIETSRRG